MKSILCLISFVFLLTGCEKESEPDRQIIDFGGLPVIEGVYSGTFERGDSTTNVTVEFDESTNTFSGTSDTDYFPAIGSGTYSYGEVEITFEDENVWPANFDWTLILSREWDMEFTDDTLIFANSIGDKYTLIKE